MFKCKECGTEYDIRPDFCDCGNDTFDEITKPAKKTAETEMQPLYKEETPISKQHSQPMLKNTDALSLSLFLFCITLAVIILFFIGNPKNEDKLSSQKTEEIPNQTVNLPSIDSLWNSSTVGIINNEKSKTKQVHKSESQPSPVQPQSVPSAQLPITPIVQKPQATQQTTKPTVQANPKKTPVQTLVQKPKQTTTAQTKSTAGTTAKPTQQTTNLKPAIPKTTQDIANGKSTSTTKPKTTQQTQTTTAKTTNSNPKTAHTQITPPKTATAQNTQTLTTTNIPTSTTIRPKTAVDAQALKKELNNYKIGLRNTIGKKIDFASVIGDGDCTVSFKIASNGKLTNRSFSKQSSNITLNDAVYSAVMSTPSYNPPPTGYNNETMNLHIRFYNGNFDISLN